MRRETLDAVARNNEVDYNLGAGEKIGESGVDAAKQVKPFF